MTEKEIRDSIGRIGCYEKFYEDDLDCRLCDNRKYDELKCRYYCSLGKYANCNFECCYQDVIDEYYGKEENE